MENFNSLMPIYLILISVNIVLLLGLWSSIRTKHFSLLLLHWFSLLLGFYVQRSMIGAPPFLLSLMILIPNFLIHITLIMSFRNMIGLPISVMRTLLAPVGTALFIVILNSLNVSSFVLLFPMVIVYSSFYFYAAYEAFSLKRQTMTFLQKFIAVVLIIFGIHLYDFIYFYNQPDLLLTGFAVALGLEMVVSILFPAVIIEKMTVEHERLKNEVEFLAKISYSSKMASLGEMAGGVAHELNNPLTILTLYLKKLKMNIDPESTSQQLVEKCVQTTERMNRIIKGMLIFSREDQSSQFNQVIAGKMVEETLDLCAEKMKIHQIDLSVDMPERTINFIGNGTQLSQVLLNLLNNSYDAIINLEKKWIKIVVKDLGDKVEFSVTDSGRRLDEEVANKMFNPFFTTKDTGVGTGLGLSISKGILEKHKGKFYLDVESPNTRIVFAVPKFHFVQKMT
jgi:signal transduction histidine kinase